MKSHTIINYSRSATRREKCTPTKLLARRSSQYWRKRAFCSQRWYGTGYSQRVELLNSRQKSESSSVAPMTRLCFFIQQSSNTQMYWDDFFIHPQISHLKFRIIFKVFSLKLALANSYSFTSDFL